MAELLQSAPYLGGLARAAGRGGVQLMHSMKQLSSPRWSFKLFSDLGIMVILSHFSLPSHTNLNRNIMEEEIHYSSMIKWFFVS